MDEQIRSLHRQAQSTDDPADWTKLCHAQERLIDPDLFNQIIVQFRVCTRWNRRRKRGNTKGTYCSPDWCPHIKIRVLGLHTFDALRPLTANPLWGVPCGSCGDANRDCTCGDNMEIYTCDYCGQDTLIEDTLPTDRDEHACQNCFVTEGLFRWRDTLTPGFGWLNPINKRWTKHPMRTLQDLKNAADTWKGTDKSLASLKRYANALGHSLEFLARIIP